MGLIYCIKNKVNGKCYVGQTVRPLNKRYPGLKWWKKGLHSNELLHKAYEKYGSDSFVIDVIEENINSIEELNVKESFWIGKLNGMSPNGYNLKGGGDNKFFLQEIKNKISSKAIKNRGVGIICSNGQSYNSISEASKELGVSESAIRNIIRCLSYSANGLTFAKKGERFRDPPAGHTQRKIYCSNGKAYESLAKAAEDTEIEKQVIRVLCRGYKSSKILVGKNIQLQFSLIERDFSTGETQSEFLSRRKPKKPKKIPNYFTVSVTCSNGKTYNSIREASKDTGASYGMISEVLGGRANYANLLSFAYYPHTPPYPTRKCTSKEAS